MKKLYRYEVTGRGHFPLDMLRYDCCWPSTSEDVQKLIPAVPSTPRTIKLSSHSKPTEGRWNSFLWAVTKVEVR